MTGSQLLVVGTLALVCLAGFPALRGMWKGGDGLARVERGWRRFWPYGEEALQGWLRAQMAVYLVTWFMLITYPAALMVPAASASTRPLVTLVLWIGLAGFVAMVVATISIVLFNAPKRLALPELRDQEGLLTGWIRRRWRRTKGT